MIIRPFEQNDFPQWLPLWNANNLGVINEPVTTETWTRICDPESQVYGLGAFNKDQLIGLVHYILHPTTGAIEPICYMQDVFVHPSHRKKGIARKMVEHLVKIGKREKWARMYWLAEANNTAAQNLYKTLGVRLDFTLHIMPLN